MIKDVPTCMPYTEDEYPFALIINNTPLSFSQVSRFGWQTPWSHVYTGLTLSLLACLSWLVSCLQHYDLLIKSSNLPYFLTSRPLPMPFLCLESSSFSSSQISFLLIFKYCYGLICVSHNSQVKGPHPQYLRVWPYLEGGSFLNEMKSFSVARLQYD